MHRLPGHSLVLAADLVAATMSRLAEGHRVRRSGLDIEGATWTIPWTLEGSTSTVRSIRSIREWSMVGVVCDTTIFIDHAPAGPPARARPKAARSKRDRLAGTHIRRPNQPRPRRRRRP
jgi:hypothetical protein